MNKFSIHLQLGASILSSALTGLAILVTASGAFAATPICRNILPTPSMTTSPRQLVTINRSQTYNDPLIAQARNLRVADDFKSLADLQRKNPPPPTIENGSREDVRNAIELNYTSRAELLPAPAALTQAKWTCEGTEDQKKAISYIENHWKALIKKTPPNSTGSLIPLPYPVIIPGDRFQESYYWDSYFAVQAFLLTGRLELATMQVENFLHMIDAYGLVPNGMRTYYLSRSQPPLLTSMIRDIVEAKVKMGGDSKKIRQWLKDRALPLLERDYREFWMNPETRYNAKTGLNHHWDSENAPRPERHATDNEEKLGKTYRDTRAEAESGKDFTSTYEGESTQIAGVLLNSIMYKLENDLGWLYGFTGQISRADEMRAAASKRRRAINFHLWDNAENTYLDFNLRKGQRVREISADMFVPLWAGLASPDQARGVMAALPKLEGAGGIMASAIESGKQWDAPYGWAPQHFFALYGMREYKFNRDAERIGLKFTRSNEAILRQTGYLVEKFDAKVGGAPIENGDKYPTQSGFLWTNSVYLWTLSEILGVRLKPLDFSTNRIREVAP